MAKKTMPESEKAEVEPGNLYPRSPVHVVYGGADRFAADTPQKLGRLAVASIRSFAPNFVVFANAMGLRGSEHLPSFPKAIKQLEADLKVAPEKIRRREFSAWFAWTIYQKVIEKLKREPLEDFRIDFEDGYGFRNNEEEDGHAVAASSELAILIKKNRNTTFSGFRIKSFAPETYERAVRTLELFLQNLVENTGNIILENFVVTLPKVTNTKQIKDLCKRLATFEKQSGLTKNSIGVELMIETPESIIDSKGRVAVRSLMDAAKGRCTSVHFGAYDYTSALGITASHQDIRHPACSFARQMMQVALAGTDIRLVDSVTTIMPVPIHRSETLTDDQKAENRRVVHAAWHRHFQNVTNSMIDGFYQSWDLHPNQLPARYAAVYSFFLTEMDSQAMRLKAYVDRATKATLTGNTFDDAASVNGLINFFAKGIACGAFSENEVQKKTGSTLEALLQKFRLV